MNKLATAKAWMTDNLTDFFRAERASGERDDGGVNPATVSSAIDSLSQAPPDIRAAMLPNMDDAVAFLMIADLVGTDTELQDLL